MGFSGATYRERAALARKALDLRKDGKYERRSMIEEGAAFHDFLAERMPAVLTEWQDHRRVLGLGH